MTGEKLAAIKERVEAATPGYWIAGTLAGDLRHNTPEGARTIACIELARGHESVGDLLYHAHQDITDLLAEVKALREIAQVVADGEVYHDSKGGMLMVASPDALLSKARALLERE